MYDQVVGVSFGVMPDWSDVTDEYQLWPATFVKTNNLFGSLILDGQHKQGRVR